MPVSILYIGNKLAAKGFTPTGMEILCPLLEKEGYTVYTASDKVFPLLRMLDMLLHVMRLRNKVQVVLIDVYSSSAFYYAYCIARLCRVIGMPYITILRGGNLPHRMKRSRGMCNSIFKHSMHNIALSAYMQLAMARNNYNCELIPNSITLANYPYKNRSSISVAMLWVRSFHAVYNPQMAIRLLHALIEKYPDAHLTMVGPDKDRCLAECQQLAKELGITEKVRFTGLLTKKEWVSLAANHDIFINTTDFDNMPISLIEAMATGLPVVSTNVGGIPSLVTHGVNGLLVEKNDLTAMHSSVEYLMQNSETAAELGKQGRATAENFDWNVVKVKWINILNSIS
jgi:Glycosyltransferase